MLALDVRDGNDDRTRAVWYDTLIPPETPVCLIGLAHLVQIIGHIPVTVAAHHTSLMDLL